MASWNPFRARWVQRIVSRPRLTPSRRRKRSWPDAQLSSLVGLEERVLLIAFSEFVDPNPGIGNRFGDTVVTLSNGNVVITSPNDSAGGTAAGAVYLFNGQTGALISTLTGSSSFDRIGNGGVTALPNGNFVVRSADWDNGAVVDAGAVTWGNGTTGISGVVSAANSLVGSSASDFVGEYAITVLTNGNYLVSSPSWHSGGYDNPGALTWGSGASGVSGTISAANSLVNGRGSRIATLANGNYVSIDSGWKNGLVVNAGAVTWGNGSSGTVGVISSSNSLVGSAAEDSIGDIGLTTLPNGNYMVVSSLWDNGGATDAGAVTWGDGTTGVNGVVSAVNSLVGTTSNDRVGLHGITVLTNGNCVIKSGFWSNGSVAFAGAATWCDAAVGIFGAVSATNSLVGSSTGDFVATDNNNLGVIPLTNGNYVVRSSQWNNGAIEDVGAVTWGNGTTGVTGVISIANSLIGSKSFDSIGETMVTPLVNGNYVVGSRLWDNGAVLNTGAVTWGNGTTGITGVVSAANSLVGTTANDWVGWRIVALSNGNYVVGSQYFDNGAALDSGAVTWGNGSGGTIGAVSAVNSLVGSSNSDQIGAVITPLLNGNYVVTSVLWNNGGIADTGAVTWGNGASGTFGSISATNSLVGSSTGDQIGLFGVTVLSNSNYVVRSNFWDNGLVIDAGAVTWGNGTTGVSGVVSAANSLVGSSENDKVGSRGVTALSNGHYVVASPDWDNGAVVDAGAVTWGKGTTGISGVVSASNSLIGQGVNSLIGSGGVIEVSGGNFVVNSPNSSNGAFTSAGALTWGSGTLGVYGYGVAGTLGPANQDNSILGETNFTSLGSTVIDPVNGTFFGRFLAEGGGRVRVGLQEYTAYTFANGTLKVLGTSRGEQIEAATVGGEIQLSSDLLNHGTGITMASVSGIQLLGLGGDDTLVLDNSLGATILASAYGGEGNDTVLGGAGDDKLYGDGGADSLDGRGGNDTLYFDNLDTAVAGGSGVDTAYVWRPTAGVILNLVSGNIEVVNSVKSIYNNSFNATGATWNVSIVGGSGDDTIIGGNLNDILDGAEGNDVLVGNSGNDRLKGRGGADSLNGGNDNDILYFDNFDTSVIGGNNIDLAIVYGATAGVTLNLTSGQIETANASFSTFNNTLRAIGATWAVSIIGGTGNDSIYGGNFDDILQGGFGDDRIDAGAGNDRLFGDTGNDILIGRDGVDSVSGGTGNDTLYIDNDDNSILGGADSDTVVVYQATAAVNLNITTLQVESVNASTSTFNNIFNASTTTWSVSIIGGAGNEMIRGGSQSDILSGGAGNDTISGGSGDDTITGGEGSDTASYTNALNGVTVNLVTRTSSGAAGNDALNQIENIIGSQFSDSIIGNSLNNILHGGDNVIGNDTIVGGGGTDTILNS